MRAFDPMSGLSKVPDYCILQINHMSIVNRKVFQVQKFQHMDHIGHALCISCNQGWGRLQKPDYDYDYSAHKIIDYDYDYSGD